MSDNGKHNQDLSSQERADFLESLIEHSDPWIDNSAIFIEHLDDEAPGVRAMALRGLWFLPDPALIDRLIQMAELDPSPLVRAKAIGSLGIYIHEGEMADYGYDWGALSETLREDELPEADFLRVRDFLLGVYADEKRSLDERRFAIEALAFLSDPKIIDLIEQAYHRPEREMKISAVFAMGRNGHPRWTEILRQELFNADRDIQREAIWAAGELELDELGKELWRLTYDDDQETMLDAIIALGQTGWDGAFERLEELTSDMDLEVAQVAEAALEEWLFMDEMRRQMDELEPDDWDEEDLFD